MKVRSVAALTELLDAEIAWRIQELHSIRSDVQSASGINKSGRIRAATALLYAHWEGFIRASAEAYLCFVATKGLRLEQLIPNLLASCLRSKLKEFESTNDIEDHIKLLMFLQGGLKDHAKLPVKQVVNTGGNLNSERTKRIVHTLGFDYKPYELKENLLDSQLLHWRNNIAHGKQQCPSESDFQHLYQEIIDLIRMFKNQIENAATAESFLRK